MRKTGEKRPAGIATEDGVVLQNPELEQFTYIVSHDFKAPLRTISGFARLLDERYRGKLDQDADEFIDFIVQASDELSRMLDALLEMSRVERRGQPMLPTDANNALDDALRMLEKTLSTRGARVDRQQLPVVIADRKQLTTVFCNVIENAVRFCDEETPQITVGCTEVDGKQRFEVSDNGTGIPEPAREDIFQIFRRLDPRGKSGIGAGLALCRRIIERHGGRIWAEPGSETGTRIFFTLSDS